MRRYSKLFVEFDDVDGDTLIDRKRRVVTMPRWLGQTLRQSDVLARKSLSGTREVPTEEDRLMALRMFGMHDVKNIKVRIVKQ